MRDKEKVIRAISKKANIFKSFESEDELLDYTKLLLDLADVYYIRNEENIRGGIPDIVACIDGVFVGIELKDNTGIPTVQQLTNIANIKGSGGRANVCRTLSQVIALVYA